MRFRRTLGAALLGVGLLPGLAGCALAQSLPPPASAPFDYYVMTLSWSPGFCDTGGDERSPQQCAAGSGNGFVVHGLWPDSRRGPDPEDCSARDVSSFELAGARGLYPTAGLARYEYRKHGTCTGLSPRDYFATVRTVRDGFVIPPILQAPTQPQRMAPRDIQQAFMSVNANLKPINMAVTCVRGELVDVRFCLTRNLRAFAVCPNVTARTCRSDSISIAPVR